MLMCKPLNGQRQRGFIPARHWLKLDLWRSSLRKHSGLSCHHADVEPNTGTADISAAEEGTAAISAYVPHGFDAGGCGRRWLHVRRCIAR